jgi:uncharacterized protein HemX
MNSIKTPKAIKETKEIKETKAQNEFFKTSINDISEKTNILFVFFLFYALAISIIGLKLFSMQKGVTDFNTTVPFLERSVGLLAEDSQKMQNQIEELNSTIVTQTKQIKTLQLKLKKIQDKVDCQDKQIDLLRATLCKNEK